MISNRMQGATSTFLLHPASAANTAAATSAWTQVKGDGDALIVAMTGAVTGTIAWTVETASDGSGTGAVAITPSDGAFSAGAADQTQHRSIKVSSTLGYIRIVGTIGTGPSICGACVLWMDKNP